MSLSMFKHDPFFNSVLSSFPDEFSTLFDHRPLRTYIRDSQAISNTAVDVKETPDALIFVADLPGVKKEELKLKVEGNLLSIGGERTRESVQDSDKWHRVERSTGKFLRQFQLPKNVDLEKISASSEDGVLTVKVPKIPPPDPEKPRTIEVQFS